MAGDSKEDPVGRLDMTCSNYDNKIGSSEVP